MSNKNAGYESVKRPIEHKTIVEIDTTAKQNLEDYIRNFLKENVHLLTKVRPLIKTSKTFANSIGELYELTEDVCKCKKCTGKLFTCPKGKGKGYVSVPYYQENDDRIILRKQPCKYAIEMNETLSRVNPCDCFSSNLIRDAISLLDSLRKGDNLSLQQGLSSVYVYAANNSVKLKTSDINKGYAVCCVKGGNQLSSSLLRLVSYIYAKRECSVAYLNTPVFFKNLFSKYDDYSMSSLYDDFPKAKRADVLILENFDQIPYLDDDKVNKYLIPLFKARNKKGKITYASVTNPNNLNSIVYRNRNVIYSKDELISLIGKTLELKIIHDLDLR